jgi:zinc transport system permease protein
MGFMRQALFGLLLLAPMTAAMGVQVINFRMSFFAEAVSHSTFTGIALGILLSIPTHWSTPVFALLLGLGIIAVGRRTSLPTDAVIGVFLAGVVAFGIAMVSRDPGLARQVQQFLYGDILTITENDLLSLLVLALLLTTFQVVAFNRLLYIGLNPALAQAHRIPVALYHYLFAALLAVLTVYAVRSAGVILATGLFLVPAAAARNLARSAGGMTGWAVLIGLSSAIAGFAISVQDWARTATGATVVLVAFAWFIVSTVIAALRRR